jgi:hypothetical protein
MKQKYLILKDKKNKLFKIQEFAELDKEMLSLLCEETYEHKTIQSAISGGRDELISALRTKNMYPPGIYAEKIADAVMELHKTKDKESVELFFDDSNLLAKDRESVKVVEQIEEESSDLDEMLTDDIDDAYQDKDEIKKVNPSLKIADDDYVDIENGE